MTVRLKVRMAARWCLTDREIQMTRIIDASGYFADCMCVAVFVDGVGRGEDESKVPQRILERIIPKAGKWRSERRDGLPEAV